MMLKKLMKLGLVAGAATGLLAATPAHALILYQFWQGGMLVGQVAVCESGTPQGAWGTFTGTQVIVYVDPVC